jgi:LemA protein
VQAGNTCPSCGEVVTRNVKFCPSCGAASNFKRGSSMKLGKILMLIMAAMLCGVLFASCSVYRGYNRAVALDEEVQSAWAQVENQLQRRFDLVPNLVETVKGVAGHEKEVFTNIAKARSAYTQAKSVGQKAKAAVGFESALSRLLVIREAYPELKANQSFLKLQDSLEGTENRLSVERKRYNDTVATLNKFTRKLLGRLYASLAGVEKAEYFKVSDEAKSTPKVDFGKTPAGG